MIKIAVSENVGVQTRELRLRSLCFAVVTLALKWRTGCPLLRTLEAMEAQVV